MYITYIINYTYDIHVFEHYMYKMKKYKNKRMMQLIIFELNIQFWKYVFSLKHYSEPFFKRISKNLGLQYQNIQ